MQIPYPQPFGGRVSTGLAERSVHRDESLSVCSRVCPMTA
jgi:hypothetical protein